VHAQEVNVTDANGKKQGKWTKKHESTKNTFYVGQFKDDIRVGDWVYYYSDGKKKADASFSQGGTVCHSTLYDNKERIMAYGKYIDEKKDSTWTYYFADGSVGSREDWGKGTKHGREESYFVTGGIVESLNWDFGQKNGPFKEYHTKDVLSREGTYLKDEYEGQMTFYFENGKKEIEGKYVNAEKEGTWRFYNKDGSIHYMAVYRGGSIVKEKKENGLFKELNPDGSVVSEMTYKKGVREGEFKFYHPAGAPEIVMFTDPQTGETYPKEMPTGGALKMEGKYKAGKMHGPVKHYNDIGKLIKTESYIDGVLQ
jgi:antitoxin component YwqK of YwqJK toxin-antitoxin module